MSLELSLVIARHYKLRGNVSKSITMISFTLHHL
jgi:hypothetical protein